MKARLIRLFVCLALLHMAVHATYAQGRGGALAEIYAPVEAGQRPRLDERLRLLAGHYREQQWDKLYDLTYEPYLVNNLRIKTREEFIRGRQLNVSEAGGGFVIGFVPQTTTADVEGYYYIQGCVEARWKGETGYVWGGVRAYLVDGEWLFTSIGVQADPHNPPPSCSDMK